MKAPAVLVAITTACAVSGCAAPEYRWYKSGATQQSFNQDRYQCMQESQQRVSSSHVNMYGGSSNSSVRINRGLFNACMEARGWELRQVNRQQ